MNGKYHFRALNSVVQFSVFNLENLTDKHYTKTVEASSDMWNKAYTDILTK